LDGGLTASPADDSGSEQQRTVCFEEGSRRTASRRRPLEGGGEEPWSGAARHRIGGRRGTGLKARTTGHRRRVLVVGNSLGTVIVSVDGRQGEIQRRRPMILAVVVMPEREVEARRERTQRGHCPEAQDAPGDQPIPCASRSIHARSFAERAEPVKLGRRG
jgi:hypothetical protein